MAIAADHPCLIHLTLYKRPVDVVLIPNLAVREVQGPLRQGQSVGVQQLRAVMVVAQRAATRVTACAIINLRIGLLVCGTLLR